MSHKTSSKSNTRKGVGVYQEKRENRQFEPESKVKKRCMNIWELIHMKTPTKIFSPRCRFKCSLCVYGFIFLPADLMATASNKRERKRGALSINLTEPQIIKKNNN